MAKEKYFRERPHISVGTIGPAGHGKTTLTAAIVNFLSDRGQATGMSYDMISKGGVSVSGNKTITVFPAHIEYRTYDRHYSHLDCPGDLRYAKNIIAGAAQMDAAILVVSAAEFVAQQVDEHVRLAKNAGVRQIVVFINKCELTERPPIRDPEVVDAVEVAVREILDANQLDGDMVSVIRGSALSAMEGDRTELLNIERLLHALDEEINEPHRAIDEPFLMTIGKVHTIRGRGATVSGRVHRGMARVGDDVQILGINERRTTCIIEMETFNKRLDQGQAGDNIACMLRGVDFEDVKRGQVLACPGSTVPHVKFQAEIQVCSTDQGGRHTPFFNNYRPQIYLKTASVPGRVTLMEYVAMVMPGDFQTVTIELDKPVWMESGMLFSAREGGKTVFTGVVRQILE